MKKTNKVNMQVNSNFFDNVFEPKRKMIQQQLGIPNLTQIQFTSMIKDIKVNIKLPKQNRIVRRKFRI